MRELIVSFILVTTFSVTLNKPELPQVNAETQTVQADKASKAKEKPKTVKRTNKPKKARRQAVAKPQAVIQASKPVQVTGNKQSWLKASGIPQDQWAYVDSIVGRESGWNPNAVNPSSGACGLGQQLPCGKWAGKWNDPVSALKAMNGYVLGRYSSWAGAVAFWEQNSWY